MSPFEYCGSCFHQNRASEMFSIVVDVRSENNRWNLERFSSLAGLKVSDNIEYASLILNILKFIFLLDLKLLLKIQYL